MGELLKLAVSQVQKRHGLSKCTSFERINSPVSDIDPLTGNDASESKLMHTIN
jgi:hypothetical protein